MLCVQRARSSRESESFTGCKLDILQASYSVRYKYTLSIQWYMREEQNPDDRYVRGNNKTKPAEMTL